MMKKNASLWVMLSLLLTSAPHFSSCLAWGPLTHMAVTYETGSQNGFPVSEDLLGAYLAGTTEPDIGLGDGKSEFYGMYHSEDFAKAMENVAQTKDSPEKELLRARALGIRAHLAGDSAAHGSTGYSNAKPMFENADYGLPAHVSNELCVDMVMYAKNRDTMKKLKLNFLDLDTLIEVRNEWGNITGKAVENDRDTLQKDLLSHKATVVSEFSLAEYMAEQQSEKIEQMAANYSDMEEGYKGGGGLKQSRQNIRDRIKADDTLKAYKIKDIKFKLKELVVNTIPTSGVKGLEGALIKILKARVVRDKAMNLANQKISNARNKALANFAVNLMNSDLSFEESAYRAGLDAFGTPENNEDKLLFLRMEAQILKKQADRAKEKFENRPWYKFWLRFTRSDEKEYLKLQAEYEAKMGEIAALEAEMQGASTALAAASSADPAGETQGETTESSQISSTPSLASLKTAVDSAFQRYSEALQNSLPETQTNSLREEWQKAVKRLQQAAQNL